ncbi:hypothetical protein AAC387_Pa01g2430 [Persea americana]
MTRVRMTRVAMKGFISKQPQDKEAAVAPPLSFLISAAALPSKFCTFRFLDFSFETRDFQDQLGIYEGGLF